MHTPSGQDIGPTESAEYDPRYLAGIVYFNRGEYFAAHEVWEDLWRDTAGPDRRFYQGLIQAAVAVYHAGNGNARGAQRLFHSGRRYMSAYPPGHLGLDAPALWAALERALTELLPDPAPAGARLRANELPTIVLTPGPSEWPAA
jgi:predicted metal-dependent hydrolase